MQSFPRILKCLLIAALASIATLFGSRLLAPDKAPHPGTQDVIGHYTVPAAKQNAYFILLGLHACPELTPYSVGQRIMAVHEQQHAIHGTLAGFNVTRLLGPTPLTLHPMTKGCDLETSQCRLLNQWA